MLLFVFFQINAIEGIARDNRSYQINDYEAQVTLLPNGDVKVSEILVYDFSGQFNGITRFIGLKGTDGITEFKASEIAPNRKDLNITHSIQNNQLNYKIYDPSSDIQKTFLLEYRLKNVITKYKDTAEFYWQFFDQSNSSPINHVTITLSIQNGTITSDMLKVFGHGPRNGQVSIRDDGTVFYEVEQLAAGEMLEARILFPNRFVPDAPRVVYRDQFDTIMQEELQWARQAEREQDFMLLNFLLIPLLALAAVILGIRLYFKYDRELKPDLDPDYYRELPSDIEPALLSNLMSIQGVGTKDILATLMNLVRKRYLKIDEITTGRKKDYRFSLLKDEYDRLKKHEVDLIHWLFYAIGDGKSVRLGAIEKYSKTARNRTSFRYNYQRWLKTVKREFKSYHYFLRSKESIKPALTFILVEAIFLVILLLVARIMSVSLILMIPIFIAAGLVSLGLLVYAALIRKKTQQGVNEYHKWDAFKRFLLHFSQIKNYEIPSIVVWEHYLVYAISLGIADKVISKLRLVLNEQKIGIHGSTYLYHMTDQHNQLNGKMFRSFDKVFSTAFAAATASSGSGGGFSSGGGGGGGGGGAGAF